MDDADIVELRRLRMFRKFLEVSAKEHNEFLPASDWVEMADEAAELGMLMESLLRPDAESAP